MELGRELEEARDRIDALSQCALESQVSCGLLHYLFSQRVLKFLCSVIHTRLSSSRCLFDDRHSKKSFDSLTHRWSVISLL